MFCGNEGIKKEKNMKDNKSIVKENVIDTQSLTSGHLNAEQSKMFIKKTFESTNLSPLIRHEIRRSRTGEIDKIGIANRLIREKKENVDDGYRATAITSQVDYETTAVRVPWEITEETIRENIEGEDFEASIFELMTLQLGVDLEDLYLNGDEDTESTDKDYSFLKINDGWVKQIKNGGHIYDASSEDGMSIDMFYNVLAQLSNKYNNGKLRWLMSPRRAQEWSLMLINKALGAGAAVPESIYNSPANALMKSAISLTRAAAYKKNVEYKTEDLKEIGVGQVKSMLYNVLASDHPELYKELKQILNDKFNNEKKPLE